MRLGSPQEWIYADKVLNDTIESIQNAIRGGTLEQIKQKKLQAFATEVMRMMDDPSAIPDAGKLYSIATQKYGLSPTDVAGAIDMVGKLIQERKILKDKNDLLNRISQGTALNPQELVKFAISNVPNAGNAGAIYNAAIENAKPSPIGRLVGNDKLTVADMQRIPENVLGKLAEQDMLKQPVSPFVQKALGLPEGTTLQDAKLTSGIIVEKAKQKAAQFQLQKEANTILEAFNEGLATRAQTDADWKSIFAKHGVPSKYWGEIIPKPGDSKEKEASTLFATIMDAQSDILSTLDGPEREKTILDAMKLAVRLTDTRRKLFEEVEAKNKPQPNDSLEKVPLDEKTLAILLDMNKKANEGNKAARKSIENATTALEIEARTDPQAAAFLKKFRDAIGHDTVAHKQQPISKDILNELSNIRTDLLKESKGKNLTIGEAGEAITNYLASSVGPDRARQIVADMTKNYSGKPHIDIDDIIKTLAKAKGVTVDEIKATPELLKTIWKYLDSIGNSILDIPIPFTSEFRRTK